MQKNNNYGKQTKKKKKSIAHKGKKQNLDLSLTLNYAMWL